MHSLGIIPTGITISDTQNDVQSRELADHMHEISLILDSSPRPSPSNDTAMQTPIFKTAPPDVKKLPTTPDSKIPVYG